MTSNEGKTTGGKTTLDLPIKHLGIYSVAYYLPAASPSEQVVTRNPEDGYVGTLTVMHSVCCGVPRDEETHTLTEFFSYVSGLDLKKDFVCHIESRNVTPKVIEVLNDRGFDYSISSVMTEVIRYVNKP